VEIHLDLPAISKLVHIKFPFNYLRNFQLPSYRINKPLFIAQAIVNYNWACNESLMISLLILNYNASQILDKLILSIVKVSKTVNQFSSSNLISVAYVVGHKDGIHSTRSSLCAIRRKKDFYGRKSGVIIGANLTVTDQRCRNTSNFEVSRG
jgi:hypothetical protein